MFFSHRTPLPYSNDKYLEAKVKIFPIFKSEEVFSLTPEETNQKVKHSHPPITLTYTCLKSYLDIDFAVKINDNIYGNYIACIRMDATLHSWDNYCFLYSGDEWEIYKVSVKSYELDYNLHIAEEFICENYNEKISLSPDDFWNRFIGKIELITFETQSPFEFFNNLNKDDIK